MLAGFVTPSEAPESSVLVWRLLLWEPWFLLCGVLLGLAARQARTRPARVRPLR